MIVEHTDPFYLKIGETIKEHSRQIIGVGSEDKKPGFYYTIGNHLQGAPEFLMIGNFDLTFGSMIMNMISDAAVMQKAPFEDGRKYKLHPEGHPVIIYDATVVAKLEYTRQATEYYQHGDYLVQQVVLPDPKGRYPGEKNCQRKYRVPVLRSGAALMAPQRLRLH